MKQNKKHKFICIFIYQRAIFVSRGWWNRTQRTSSVKPLKTVQIQQRMKNQKPLLNSAQLKNNIKYKLLELLCLVLAKLYSVLALCFLQLAMNFAGTPGLHIPEYHRSVADI